MAFEDHVLVTIPGHETWKGFVHSADIPSAARCLWEAQQLANAARAGAWDNLPMSQQYENTRKMFEWIGRMFQYMNTSPWNSPLWQDHFGKWHGTISWESPKGCGNSAWSAVVPGSSTYVSQLQNGPKIAFAGGLFVPVSCRPVGSNAGAYEQRPDGGAACDITDIYPAIFPQRIRQAAFRIKGGSGMQFGNGMHIVMFTLGPNGNLITAPSGQSPANSEPQFDFTGLYNGAGCCPYRYDPIDDRELRVVNTTPPVQAIPYTPNVITPVPRTVNEVLYNPPSNTPLRNPNIVNEIPYTTPLTVMPREPLTLTPIQPSGAVMGMGQTAPSGCGCGMPMPGGFAPSGAVATSETVTSDVRARLLGEMAQAAVQDAVSHTIAPRIPAEEYDPNYLYTDGRHSVGTGQTPRYGWVQRGCGEVPNDTPNYSWFCLRWNDAPLNIVRVLPPLRWAVDEAIDMVDSMSSIPVWDHLVRSRVRQMVEMVARADALGVPGATDPLDAPAAVMQGQQDALVEYQKRAHVDPKDPGLIATDAVVGTVSGILAAIPGMQIAAVVVGGLYALGRLLASVFPTVWAYQCDIWGRPEPSIWPATIFDPMKAPEQQMVAVTNWSAPIDDAGGPESATIKNLGGEPEKPVLPNPPASLPGLQEWMKDYVANGGGASKSSTGTALLIVAGVAGAAGLAWWLGSRSNAPAPRRNPRRRR